MPIECVKYLRSPTGMSAVVARMDVVIRHTTTTSSLAFGDLSTATPHTIDASTNRVHAFPVLWGVGGGGGGGLRCFGRPGFRGCPGCGWRFGIIVAGSLLGVRLNRVCGESGREVALLGDRVLWFSMVRLLFRWSIWHRLRRVGSLRRPISRSHPYVVSNGVLAGCVHLHGAQEGRRRKVWVARRL